MFVKIKTKDQYANIRFEVCGFGANGNEWIADYHRLRAITHISISVDISHISGNLITVIFDYQIFRKPLKILSL